MKLFCRKLLRRSWYVDGRVLCFRKSGVRVASSPQGHVLPSSAGSLLISTRQATGDVGWSSKGLSQGSQEGPVGAL